MQNNASDSPQAVPQHEVPRFPIRLRWTLFVGLAVAAAVVLLAGIVLDMERDAWLKSQEAQAEIQVKRLGDELKIPMLAGSSAEVDFIIQNFSQSIPNVTAVYFQDQAGKKWSVGTTQDIYHIIAQTTLPDVALHLSTKQLWFAKKVTYAGSDVGVVAVQYSEDAWESLASELLQRMFFAALFVIVLASLVVYWLAGRMSKPLEELAEAAQFVADGDYDHRLHIRGNDEFTDAATQFNRMMDELQHKEEMRKVLGRYLNPELVSDVFDGEHSSALVNRKQEVTVLFADMVSFTAFSESAETEEVVDVLNQYFEVFHSIIDYFGGHVDKYIGDAVMAVFNHPKEDKKHTRNAVMAGIAMTVACKHLGILRKDGSKVSFRIGLNRGDVIVGNIGAAERLEYTVIGDAVNVASRMGGLGGADEVVLPKATFDMSGQGFSFGDMGKIAVKGVSEALQCGVVKVQSEKVANDISFAVARAFDMTLPTSVRVIVGDIN
ncbi:MAG TPA: adenylate/guanylate cyclase domain-containing protein [Mariprofundaceae bacterium]|nr:adenylate/guanylate cyclase domain-containing protein [Mariprofundaceae bacterium]